MALPRTLRSKLPAPFFLLAGLFLAAGASAQSLIEFTPLDVTAADTTVVDAQGVRWVEGATTGGGSGVFHPFLRLGNDGVERGFNTDASPVPLDDKSGPFTHSFKLSTLQAVTIVTGIESSEDFYVFHLDANELSGVPNSLLCIDDLRIYASSNPALPDTASLAASATPLYAMAPAQDVKLTTALHPGGGTPDITVMIPTSYFGASPDDYVYLYVSIGDCSGDGLSASDGFEEWSALSGGDSPPLVTAPATINGEERGTLTFDVAASDPDGDAISSLTANLTSLPAGNDASFTTNADNTQGTLLWHMQAGDAGDYHVSFTATSTTLSSTASTYIGVTPFGSDVTGIFSWTPQSGQEGTYYVTFTATDAGGTSSQTDTLNITAPILGPHAAPGAPLRFPAAPESPERAWKGPIIQGTSTISGSSGTTTTTTISASTDLSGASAVRTRLAPRLLRSGTMAQDVITLTVDTSGLPAGNDAAFTVDHQPGVNATPSTITVRPGEPATVLVTAADPDGDAIESLVADMTGLPSGNPGTFVAGSMNMSGTFTWTPRLGDEGTYLVTFTATNRMVGAASVRITVTQPAAARVFIAAPVNVNLGSSRSGNCLYVEPVSGDFATSDVDLSTVRLISSGTGAVSEIAPILDKTALIADRDNNLVLDLGVCFSKDDLRLLFSNLTKKTVVTVTMRGQLTSGAYFEGSAAITVISNGPNVGTVSVAPNPLNPQAKLSLTLGKGGWLKVSLYDAQGRLVRVLADESHAVPGPRDITVDGTDTQGRPLASGVYYYKVQSADGVTEGKLAIVR